MKLVIQTQELENYGVHNWDGKGEVPQYWKAKGGSTYVVENLSWLDVGANREFAAKVCNLVAMDTDSFREYVIDWSFEEDDAKVCESWEAPYVLSQDGENWIVAREREPYGNTHLFDRVSEKWVYDSEFAPVADTYVALYRTVDGVWATEAEATVMAQEAA